MAAEAVLPWDRAGDRGSEAAKDHPPTVAGRDSHSRSKSLDRRSRTRATVKRRAPLVDVNRIRIRFFSLMRSDATMIVND